MGPLNQPLKYVNEPKPSNRYNRSVDWVMHTHDSWLKHSMTLRPVSPIIVRILCTANELEAITLNNHDEKPFYVNITILSCTICVCMWFKWRSCEITRYAIHLYRSLGFIWMCKSDGNIEEAQRSRTFVSCTKLNEITN